ncbi:secondary thiamine-phosphate synthase enzyme YjbQ [Belliella sp. DSM 107340]|uniref:Secondary thiamine-phosphate synthase enzyme YjbQ n=1 Tax=Belliella calami TaxID=2923436 RepID=A0ABS9UMK9_9BACT|nr:secondary thiamine-phosphate synthase enzyme YjbQ [Belliella calami]MCH7397852.1 secondary thiamine-phosphate synthase enzyme YjbQ [Belliella calami]
MKLYQQEIQLKSYPRGYHLITEIVENGIPAISQIQAGVLQVFIKHTSAGLTINENADPTVRRDFETFINELVPDSYPRFIHTYEASDDMPAHLKSSFLGNSLQIPITGGKLNLGIWQGIYLCEFRNHGGPRELVLTAFGI